jgi:UDP-glucose 4-epimerase
VGIHDRKERRLTARYFIVGGAGFIGSHFCDTLLANAETSAVTIYDNFSSGRDWHIRHHRDDSRFRVVRGEAADVRNLTQAVKSHDIVIHLASNPDIARAATEPDIDFREGTALTNAVVEAMRVSGARKILYASGSGVYGDSGDLSIREDHAPMTPISTYGASKLAGEALISAYCHMFDMTGYCFRFGNVVGARQTHGVGFDFVRRLLKDPRRLHILGNGEQVKSYISAADVVSAVLIASEKSPSRFEAYNVATGDYITVSEIARLACKTLGLDDVEFIYAGGDRGWKGDVPIVRLETAKIQALGWRCRIPTREAICQSLEAAAREARQGLDD